MDALHDCCVAVNKLYISTSSLLHDATTSDGARNINAIRSEPLNYVIKAIVLSFKSTSRIKMLLNTNVIKYLTLDTLPLYFILCLIYACIMKYGYVKFEISMKED
jgi:uncharacterized Fe-S radical SAM superfamily protein PflX